MTVKTEYIQFRTRGKRDVYDMTPQIQEVISKNGISNGLVTAFVPGSTAGITTIEYEPGLKQDIDIFLEKILPYRDHYHHHNTWHDDNGAAHIQAALIGPSLSVPIVDGRLALGTWQQIILVDCDTRSRNREIVVQIIS